MRISLRPDVVYDTYRQITPALLQSRGIRLLLSDLDYTLAPKSTPRPDEALRRWLAGLQEAGIRVMILSNNRHPQRVEIFCRDLGIDYVGHAKKPWPHGFRRAMARAGVSPEQTAMLGDKLLTDVLGARLSGVAALMVEPAGGAKTPWQKVLHALQAPWKRISGPWATTERSTD